MSAPTHPAYETVRPVTDVASAVLCDNPGPMELDGTNTWVLRAPDSHEVVVVDPGPKGKKGHLDRIAGIGTVALTLITHRHRDHTGGIKGFHKRNAAPVRAWSHHYCVDAAPLADRETITAAGVRITVIHTPGHTADSVSLLVEYADTRAIITGDTILGRGTTVLDPEDGGLRDYMSSLDRLIVETSGSTLLPGHGPDHPDIEPVARFYKKHREERLDQIKSILDEMKTPAAKAKPMSIVRRAYTDVDKTLWPAARASVKAQLAYLADHDRTRLG